jgi:hypothetical protein
VLVHKGPAALVRRALKLALRELVPDVDVRSSSAALDLVVERVGAGQPGQIHLAGGVVAVVLDEGVKLLPPQLAAGPVPAYAPWDLGADAAEGTEDP